MPTTLTPAAVNALTSWFPNDAPGTGGLISTANKSPYLAGEINSFVQSGGTITVPSGSNEAFTSGTAQVTIGSEDLPSENSAVSMDALATLVSHELAHAGMPGGLQEYTGTVTGVVQSGETAEGDAMVSEFVVSSQLNSTTS